MALSCRGNINLIAAVGRNGEIGKDNGLPWPKEKGDTRFFKTVTRGGIVIVGGRTWESVKHLDGTEGRTFIIDPPCSPAEMIAAECWSDATCPPVWIAGGAVTWRKWAPYIDGMRIINFLDWYGPADTFFPFDAFGINFEPHPSLVALKGDVSAENIEAVVDGYAQGNLRD